MFTSNRVYCWHSPGYWETGAIRHKDRLACGMRLLCCEMAEVALLEQHLMNITLFQLN